jgi:hypothetical protein
VNLHVSSFTYSFSGFAAQTALGILHAFNVSWLCHDCTAIVAQPTNILYDLYSLPIIVRVIKSRRMRWAWHVTRMGKGRGVHRVLVGKPEGKR